MGQIGDWLCTTYEFCAVSLSISAVSGVSCLLSNLCLCIPQARNNKRSLKLDSSHSEESAGGKRNYHILGENSFHLLPVGWHLTNVNLFNSKWKKTGIISSFWNITELMGLQKGRTLEITAEEQGTLSQQKNPIQCHCVRWKEKERSTKTWRMHIQGWRIFMNREDSEMHEVQKTLLVYLACIDLYLHIFCLC